MLVLTEYHPLPHFPPHLAPQPLNTNVCLENPVLRAMKGPNKPKGYTWGVVSAVVKLLGWLLLLPVTLVYCCGCALASAILWLWGLSSVFSWMYLKHSHTSVMPEEENTGNFTNKGTDVEQFNVGSLLKMTTGMVVEELVMRVKLKE